MVRVAVDGGVDVARLRERHASARDRYEADHELRTVATDTDVPLVINDRADIAAVIDADGVHLGNDDVPASVARKQLDEDAIVGRSASAVAGTRAAEEAGADYLGVGAVFATDTKEANPEQSEIGTEHVSTIAGAVSILFAGIGGITPGSATNMVAAGADGVAVVSAITTADDPADAIRHLADSVATGKNRR